MSYVYANSLFFILFYFFILKFFFFIFLFLPGPTENREVRSARHALSDQGGSDGL